jgi:lipase chaperone LimK
MAALMRNVEHWGQLVPYLDAIAGVGPSINGSPKFDEVGMILKAKSICDLNGYTLLAQATPAQLSPIFKRAFYTNTGVRIRRLQKQAAMLRLEKRAQS